VLHEPPTENALKLDTYPYKVKIGHCFLYMS